MKTNFKGIMNVFFYYGVLGERVKITYWNRKPKYIDAKNRAEAFKKMPKSARAFCLKSKDKNVIVTPRDYAISYWYNK